MGAPAHVIRKQLGKPADSPRAYQREDLGKLKIACDFVARVLYVAFMGTGKTVVAAMLARHWVAQGDRVLYLVHRWEILKQTEAKLVAAGVPRSMIARHRRREGKDYGVNLDAPIHLASIDTLRARDVIPGITRIVVDEAHHTPTKSWTEVIERYPGVRLLGLTATPVRLDGAPLVKHFDSMIVQSESVESLIEQGWLSRPELWTWEDGWAPDLRGVAKVGGDYTRKGAARSMSAIVGRIPKHWKKLARGKPTVLFAATENQIDAILTQFRRAGIKADKLLGYDDDKTREAKLSALESGRTKVLCTCDVLGEGWDFPAARCVVLAAPTASLARFLQRCGRGMRPGAPPVIIDCAGSCRVHGPPWADQEWSLTEGAQPTKHIAEVGADGRVTYREPIEVEGKLVRADYMERQTVCAGPVIGGTCPTNEPLVKTALYPDSIRRRKGMPWRCPKCRCATHPKPPRAVCACGTLAPPYTSRKGAYACRDCRSLDGISKAVRAINPLKSRTMRIMATQSDKASGAERRTGFWLTYDDLTRIGLTSGAMSSMKQAGLVRRAGFTRVKKSVPDGRLVVRGASREYRKGCRRVVAYRCAVYQVDRHVLRELTKQLETMATKRAALVRKPESA